jgi:HAE1 family hydrophobic/amphiphilic exporter-1
MTLPELSVHRHVFAYMLSGVLILFGVISYQRIGVDRFPSIEFPMIAVTTVLPGANPSVVDAAVTNIIETTVNSVPGIDSISSSSRPSLSMVAIQFDLTKNPDVAFNEVQAKVNTVLQSLPEDAETPVVRKIEFGAAPILWLTLQGDRTLQQLNQYARNILKKRLETVDGVGDVLIGGERERTIRVNLNIEHMTNLGIAVRDVVSAFQREHFKLPGGYLTGRDREDLLKLDLEFHQVRDLEQLIVTYRGNLPVRLREIATIEDGLAEARRFASFNGKLAVGLGIVKIKNSNTVAIINEVQRRLETDILPQLPPGLQLSIASNNADYIKEIIAALKEHLVTGTLLAALVVWLFLKSLRSTLIVATAIPVSLMGAIAAIYFAGHTFNFMTMLGLLLLIGVVVDDAIVVLENIFRHREENLQGDVTQVTIQAANEVVFAVLAASFTLVSIFAAVIFIGGIIGQFLRPFAVVVTLGVLVSLFVSVTLTPMLCARYLRVSHQHGFLYRWLEVPFRLTEDLYRLTLRFALRFRWTVVFLAIGVVLSSGHFLGQLGKGFMPEEDEGRFLVSFKTPLGSTLDYTQGRLREIEKILQTHPEVDSYFSSIGTGQEGQVTQGTAFVRMVPRSQRTLKQYDLIPKLRQELAKIPGVLAFASPAPDVGGDRGEPLQFVLRGQNLYEVARLAKQLQTVLAARPEIGNPDTDLQLDLPEVTMHLDHTKAEELGLSALEVAQALRVLAGGLKVAKYNDDPGDGERYDIYLKAGDNTFFQAEDLKKIYLRTSRGDMVRLDTIAQFQTGLGAAIITRYNLQYAAFFFATPTISEGDAAEIVKQEAAKLLPSGYQVELIGRAKEFGKTVGYLIFAFVTGLILVYMVLASQFNSFIQPLIIMVAQPLAIIGGVFGLWLTGHFLNIYSMIGLVLLVGLVAKNSILLIDLTNQYRAQGQEIREALLAACPVRMRPVLMTSLTIILALLPAAMGIGAGADTNGPLAVAVIGGMVSSTLLTLVVVPAVYSLVENTLLYLTGQKKIFQFQRR